MKTTIKSGLAALLLLAISCRKDNCTIHSSTAAQLTEKLLALKIGQFYQGGVIFYIDSTGQHGLIADTADFPKTVWWNGVFTVTGATGTAIGTGKKNIKKIILSQVASEGVKNFSFHFFCFACSSNAVFPRF